MENWTYTAEELQNTLYKEGEASIESKCEVCGTPKKENEKCALENCQSNVISEEDGEEMATQTSNNMDNSGGDSESSSGDPVSDAISRLSEKIEAIEEQDEVTDEDRIKLTCYKEVKGMLSAGTTEGIEIDPKKATLQQTGKGRKPGSEGAGDHGNDHQKATKKTV